MEKETNDVINTRNWELLLDAIDKERVVPIIGTDVFYVEEKDSNKSININEFLVGKLCEKFGIINSNADFTTIADTIDEENYKNRRSIYVGSQTDIYYEVNQILREVRVKCKSEIIDLLSIRKFPLILTTSCVSGLEPDLQATYGNINIITYNKSSQSDIETNLSSSNPSIYYLFGKCTRMKKSFLVTEDDLLDYLHLWHNIETRPTRISNYLKDKFLLVLGCNYPNWLFRFFWHSIRNFTIIPNNNEMQGVVMLEEMSKDKELTTFLSRIQTQIYANSSNFIEEFLQRWNSRSVNVKTNDKVPIDNNIDIFISYAKEDVLVVKDIAERFRNLGAEVWLDENKLEWSDMYENIIEEKISKTKRFVPVISQTTIKPDRRFFRREWAMAIREMDYRYGMPFFAPIIIDGTDINNTLIPEPFRKSHIINISDYNVEEEMKKLIRSFR